MIDENGTKVRVINVPECWLEVEVNDDGTFDLIATRWRGNEKVRVVLHLRDYQASEVSSMMWRVVQKREKQVESLRNDVGSEPEVAK